MTDDVLKLKDFIMTLMIMRNEKVIFVEINYFNSI
jgi:hypothetical protein